MSTTTSTESALHNPARRRRWSKETDPPTMSIILLGKDVSTNCRVGNFMLGRSAFDSEAPPDDHQIERVRGKDMMIINCPHLLQLNLSYHQIIQTVRECVDLSHPGPHLILLIFKPDECSREDQEHVENILNYFSDSVYQHTLVLTTHDSHTEEQTEVNDNIQKIIEKCFSRHCRLERNSSPDELKKKCEDIVRSNDGHYLICEEFIDSQSFIVKQQTDERNRVKLNLVLCGSDRRLKSSISKLMMKESSRRSVMRSDFMRREMEVCGRLINLMELPALSRLSEDEVMRQTLSCLSLCDPGVHVFLIIVPDGPLTDEDKEEMQAIHIIFNSGKHFVVIFTSEFTVDRSVTDTQTFSTETQSLISLCGGKHRVLELKEDEKPRQIPDLLDYIEDIKTEPYSLQMYVRAQEKRGRHELEEKYKENLKRMENKIKQLQQKIQSYGDEDDPDDLECLRIMLIGRTGSGKSATGNTILGRNEFQSLLCSDSVTPVCEKRVCEVDGRSVAVVDTPGLFDTTMPNEKIQEEMMKCVSLSAPGPHAFIIVLSLGRFTQEESETIDLIRMFFGPKAAQFSLVLFTRGDDLTRGGESIEDYVKRNNSEELKKLIRHCGNRYLAFNNNEKQDRTQVTKLIKMIEEMKTTNHGRYFTNSMFEEAEMSIKKRMEEILKEKEREIQTQIEEIKAKHEIEMKNIMKRLEEEEKKADEERVQIEKKLRKNEETLRIESEKKKKTEEQKRDEEKQKLLEEEKQRAKYHQKIEEMKREIEQQRSQYEKREKEREEEDRKREEKYRQDQENMIHEQEQIIAELQKKQEEEIKKRNLDEQKRSEQEEREKQEWARKIREAENDRKEIQEKIKRQQREWEEDKKQQMKERAEDERRRKERHEEQLREKQEELKKMRKKFEKEKKEERQKREKETQKQRQEREQKEREYEEKKKEMLKQYEELEQRRKDEWERKRKEDDERREEERKRWEKRIEDIKREKEEIRRIEKEQEEMKQEHEQRIKKMKKKHKDEARKHAEEFNEFKEKKEKHVKELKEMLEERQKQHKLEEHYQYLKQWQAEECRRLQEDVERLKNKSKSDCVIL